MPVLRCERICRCGVAGRHVSGAIGRQLVLKLFFLAVIVDAKILSRFGLNDGIALLQPFSEPGQQLVKVGHLGLLNRKQLEETLVFLDPAEIRFELFASVLASWLALAAVGAAEVHRVQAVFRIAKWIVDVMCYASVARDDDFDRILEGLALVKAGRVGLGSTSDHDGSDTGQRADALSILGAPTVAIGNDRDAILANGVYDFS